MGQSLRSSDRVTRRATLRGLIGSLAATRLAMTRTQAQEATPIDTQVAAVDDELVQGLIADIEAAMQTYGVLGSSAALVQGDQIIFARGFGVGDLERNLPVTERTRFRIASNTKSMSAFLVATFVDEGVLRWDDRVIDVWPEFRAPNAELTDTLRVRDLLGMGTGIAESATVEFFMSGGEDSPLDVLRSAAYLPVVGEPGSIYYYNNTLVCVAAYLGSLKQGTAPESLSAAFASLLAERLFTPAGMADAAIIDDPRPLGDNYAVGYARDLFQRTVTVPFISIDGVAPAGSGVASAVDMANYLIMQMQGGVAVDGTRLVSAANLAETHKPGILVPPDVANALPSLVLPDTTASHYCLGWFQQTFSDGRQLLWHAGGIDGFASLMCFFPAEQIGFVVLTNTEGGGALCTVSLQSSFFARVFGYNQEVPAALAALLPEGEAYTADLVAQTRPIDAAAVQPYLGLYESGFRLRLDAAGTLHLDHDIRSMPLLALADGGYLTSSGPAIILGRKITFAGEPATELLMTIDGIDPVRWLTAG